MKIYSLNLYTGKYYSMLIENLLFFLFSFFSVFFALGVILSKNPVHSILCLILVFFNCASLFIILGAEFLALLFVIVYVGAVAVLFLFVVMLLNIKIVKSNALAYRYMLVAIIFGFFFFFLLLFILYNDLTFLSTYFLPLSISFNYLTFWFSFSLTNILVVGFFLYTKFFFLLILSGIILLVSMLGAITLTLHKRSDVKKQYVFKQINISFNNSVLCKV